MVRNVSYYTIYNVIISNNTVLFKIVGTETLQSNEYH